MSCQAGTLFIGKVAKAEKAADALAAEREMLLHQITELKVANHAYRYVHRHVCIYV